MSQLIIVAAVLPILALLLRIITVARNETRGDKEIPVEYRGITKLGRIFGGVHVVPAPIRDRESNTGA